MPSVPDRTGELRLVPAEPRAARFMWWASALVWPLLVALVFCYLSWQGNRYVRTEVGLAVVRAFATLSVALSAVALIRRGSVALRVARLAALAVTVLGRGLFIIIAGVSIPGAGVQVALGGFSYVVLVASIFIVHYYAEAHGALQQR